MPTVLNLLTAPNVVIDSSLVRQSTNTTTVNEEINNWRLWKDFNYENVIKMYSSELSADCPLHWGRHEPLKEDLKIRYEDALESVLLKYFLTDVNQALSLQDATASTAYYAKGSRCGQEIRADWAVICPTEDIDAKMFAPGDTKLHLKWSPEMHEHENTYEEWAKPLNQICNYMAMCGSRYGFIITDYELVLFRLTRCPIGKGIAANRDRRVLPSITNINRSHTRNPSETSMESSSSQALSMESSHDLSMASSRDFYEDSDPSKWSYLDPEYVTILMNASGEKVLTAKLALWALAMMSVNGDNSIEYKYPALNSWRGPVGGSYTHNTSGAMKNTLDSSDEHEEPDYEEPEEAAKEAASEIGFSTAWRAQLPNRP
ncbi:hypothetical protein V8C37DRAFT_394595 [Trichoderma ceciliae]